MTISTSARADALRNTPATRIVLLLSAVTLLSFLSSCGRSEPTPVRAKPVAKFDTVPGGTRAFESFHTVDGLGERIVVPEGARRAALHFDCSAPDGDITLSTSDGGLAVGGCSAKHGDGHGVILNDLPAGAHELQLSVDVPAGGEWSAAVDLVR